MSSSSRIAQFRSISARLQTTSLIAIAP